MFHSAVSCARWRPALLGPRKSADTVMIENDLDANEIQTIISGDLFY